MVSRNMENKIVRKYIQQQKKERKINIKLIK